VNRQKEELQSKWKSCCSMLTFHLQRIADIERQRDRSHVDLIWCDKNLQLIKEERRQISQALNMTIDCYEWHDADVRLDQRYSETARWREELRGLERNNIAAHRFVMGKVHACEAEIMEIQRLQRKLGALERR
jgi:hypothetical protein